MEYRREIDGLRALAVLPVVLFHAGYPAFSGGFVGVDIFFVISGYLITTLLAASLDAGTFSLVDFYERRARRILPALYTVVLSCAALAWVFLMPADLEDFGRSMLAVAGFASNFLFWHGQGYFGPAAEMVPLLHTWSLAVEEQYYVLFPLLLMLVWRCGARQVGLLLAALACASLVLAQSSVLSHPAAAFYLLPARAWELLAGALAALYLRRPHGWQRPAALDECGALAGLALIVGAIIAFDQTTPFPGLYALVPTLGAVLIILCASPASWTGRLLGCKALVGIGLISYSTYLWHQPLLAFARLRLLGEPGPLVTATLVAAALVLGYLTWRYVETPARDRARLSPTLVWRASLAGAAALIAVGALWIVQNGYGGYYFSTLSDQQKRRVQLIKKHTGYDLYEAMFDDGHCRFWGRAMNAPLERRFADCAARYGQAVLVVGDSHAMNFYNVMATARPHPFIVGISQGNCRIDSKKSICGFADLDSFLDRQAGAIRVLVYQQTGSPLLLDARGKAFAADKFSGREPLHVDRRAIADIFERLERRAGAIPVVWVGPWAEAHVSGEAILRRSPAMNSASVAAFEQLELELGSAAAERSGRRVDYVSALQTFTFPGRTLWQGDCLVFRDHDHLSRCGETYLAATVERRFWERVQNGAPH